MSYREPAPRPLRLWFVTIGYQHLNVVYVKNVWQWARESHTAMDLAAKALQGDPRDITVIMRTVITGDDFAEREIKGPPKPKEAKG